MQEQIDTLEKNYRTLLQRVDRLDQIEKDHDFTIRDSSVKIGIAEGLAETTFKEIRQLSLEMHQLRAELRETRRSTDEQFERLERKIDSQFETIMQRIDTQDKGVSQKFETLESMLKQVISKLP